MSINDKQNSELKWKLKKCKILYLYHQRQKEGKIFIQKVRIIE